MIPRLLLLLLLLAVPAEATILFQTDFEDATVPVAPSNNNVNDRYQGAPAGWALARNSENRGLPFNGGRTPDECYFTTEQSHSGSKALKIQYTVFNPNEPGNTSSYAECSFCLGNDCILPSVSTGIPDLLEVYMRAWVRFHNYANNPVGGGNKIIYYHTSGSTGSPNFVYHVFTGTGIVPGMMMQLPADCGSPTNGGAACQASACSPPRAGGTLNFIANCNATWFSPPNQGAAQPAQDVWHCVESHYRMNSVTGGIANNDALFEQWVNGVPVMVYSNLVVRPATVGSGSSPSVDARFRGFQIYRQGAQIGSVMYWDDIAIGDQRIGCGGVIPPPAVIPNAPASIRLNKNWLKRIWAWLLPNWA